MNWYNNYYKKRPEKINKIEPNLGMICAVRYNPSSGNGIDNGATDGCVSEDAFSAPVPV